MANPAQEKKKSELTKRSSVKKRQIQNKKRRSSNTAARSCIRTKIRAFREALQLGPGLEQQANFNDICRLLDKAAKKRIFTLNKASRLKSRLALHCFGKSVAV